MPVSIPYTYTQTETTIEIAAQIHQGTVSKATVHFDVTPVYLKLNCPPSLLQLDLLHEIDPERVQMTMAGTQVTMQLHKATPAIWTALTADATLDKVARMQRRQASIVAQEAANAKRQEAAQADRRAAEKASLEAHWSIDRTQRQAVIDIQQRERNNATQDLAEWKYNLPSAQAAREQARKEQAVAEATAAAEIASAAAAAPNIEEISDDATSTNNDDMPDLEAVPPPAAAAPAPAPAPRPTVPLPAVRRGGKIEISFTANATPTPSMPARESTMAQKMAFKATQGAVDGANADSSTNELPIFRKERGDRLFRDGDARGAIAAYTSAIEGATKLAVSGAPADPLLVARCHANRASALLKLATGSDDEATIIGARAQMRRTAADCTTANTILAQAGFDALSVEAVDAVALELKNLHRRATVHAWLGAYRLAVADLDELLTKYTAAEQLRAQVVRQREANDLTERKESDADSAATAAASPSLPPIADLPALDLAKLREDRVVFQQLLDAFRAQQHLAFKAQADRLLGALASTEADMHDAIAAYTQSLLIHPSSLPTLSNRLVARLRVGQYVETLRDANGAIGLWEEQWQTPRTGLSAVAPAPPQRDGYTLTPDSVSLSVIGAPKPATVLAITSRVKLFTRRATARVGVAAASAWIPAQADLQHALALAPLCGMPLRPIQVELEYVAHRLAQARLLSKASQARKEGAYATAIDQLTRAIESHNKWHVNSDATTEQVHAQAWCAANGIDHPKLIDDDGAAARTHHVGELAALLSDRALTHLHARAYAAAAKDASVALQVWTNACDQAVPSDAPARTAPHWYVPTLIRRGSARAFQAEWTGAIADYEAALVTKWPPQLQANEDERSKVEADLQRIREVASEPQAQAS